MRGGLPLSVGVRGGNHLGEVDHGHTVTVVQHQVELVKVSMDEAVIGQLDDKLHDLAV